MSDSDSEELEGDVEDYEGDGDLSEWAVLDSVGDFNKPLRSPPTKSHGSEVSKEDRIAKTALVFVEKLRDLVRSDAFEQKGSEKERDDESHTDSTGVKGSSHIRKEPEKKGSSSDTVLAAPSTDQKSKERPGHSESHAGKKTDTLKHDDSRRGQAEASTRSTSHKGQDKKTNISESSKSRTDPVKRHRDHSAEKTEAPKVRKLDGDSDILMAIDTVGSESESPKEVEDRDVLIQAGEKVEEIVTPVLSEEDFRNIDNMLVEEMMEGIKKEIMPRYGDDKYTVRFSPVELADLAENSVQELIKSQPNLAFYFKRQGKFKKKKGYAEVYLTKLDDVQAFIQKLLEIKLVERRVEVTVTASKSYKSKRERESVVLSFVIWLNKNSNLLKLLKTEDPSKRQPGGMLEKLQVDQVPSTAHTVLLKAIFPYATYITPPSGKETSTTEFMRPVNISYVSDRLLEAVLDCCSDFSYAGQVLSVQYTRKERDMKPKLTAKPNSEVKKEPLPVQERRSSLQDKVKQGGVTKESNNKTTKDSNNTAGNIESDVMATSSSPQNPQVDDDISSMTLDVCAGMMESLNKLKKLGTDNPNVLKILEMQNQLASLQQSLSRPKGPQSSIDEQADPWKVSSADVQGESEESQDQSDQETQQKKLSKEEKKRQKEAMMAEKQRQEMEDLERMIEEADKAEREREERAKRQIEIEKQKRRELEDRRKASWARKLIEDAKQSGPTTERDSTALKEEAQRMLRTIEDRQRSAEEAKKMETRLEIKSDGKSIPAKEKKIAVMEEAGNNASTSVEEKIVITPQEEKGIEALDPLGIRQLGTRSFQDTFKAFGAQAVSSALGAESTQVFLETAFAKIESHTQMTAMDDDSHERLTASEHQKPEQQGRAISPNRALHSGAPIYSELEYHQMGTEKPPWEYYVRIDYHQNRRCPVPECPATKVFRNEASLIDHWKVFHTPNVTMRFCHKCTAYFMNSEELKNHLINRHNITDRTTVEELTSEARMKVVTNPSFRDPGKFLPSFI